VNRLSPTQKKLLRLSALFAALTAIYLWADSAGLLEQITVEWIRAKVGEAGAWGAAAYLVAFVVGVLLYIPGIVFIVAGVVAFGKVVGPPLALFGAILAASISVITIRTVGGNLLEELENPFIQRMVGRLQEDPVLIIASLRLFMWVSPPLNTAMALSGVDFWRHLLGTTLGIIPIVVIVTLALDPILAWL
jgi:uncharacterized membrane protein YdjX (TVP38/TMEM64 family)